MLLSQAPKGRTWMQVLMRVLMGMLMGMMGMLRGSDGVLRMEQWGC